MPADRLLGPAVPVRGGHTGRTDLIITNSGSAFFFASAMVNFLTILTTIVGEKEQHLRHAMQMMGLFVRIN